MRFTSRGYETPGLASDAVLTHGGEVLLIQRGREPGKGQWALPGGFVEVGERVEEACLRELREETGVEARILGLVGVYSDPDRDPRGHVVSVTYLCQPTAPSRCEPEAGDDAARARWFAWEQLPETCFDHARILADARALLGQHAPG